MSSTLLVLGAGELAAPALRWAREAGLAAVAVDSDPRARARRLAHAFHTIPPGDVDGHLALARRLACSGTLAGVHVTDPARVGLATTLLAALEPTTGKGGPGRTADPAAMRESWRARGLAVAGSEAVLGRHQVSAFFRDDAFVPAGIADRFAFEHEGRPCEIHSQASELDSAAAQAAYLLTERAARALGIHDGPVQAELARSAAGFALVTLVPAFADVVGATFVAPSVFGKSPLQAWFAHLAGAGGPFDELALVPRTTAGWIPLRPRSAGLFAGLDGAARARALPGVLDLWIEEPGREIAEHGATPEVCGYLWAEALDRTELEQRLRAVRAALEVRVACRQVA